MIFVFDVGNTNIVLGVYEEDELKYIGGLKRIEIKQKMSIGMLVKNLFEHVNLTFNQI